MWFRYSFYDLVVSVEYIYEKIGKRNILSWLRKSNALPFISEWRKGKNCGMILTKKKKEFVT